MKAKLTGWLQSATKPRRRGVYQTRIPGIDHRATYQYWDGGTWCAYSWKPEYAALDSNANRKSEFQSVQWRGLTSDPKASKP